MHERKTVFHRLWHSDTVTCLSIDKFGSKLISGSSDHSCCIWVIESNGQIGLVQLLQFIELKVLQTRPLIG